MFNHLAFLQCYELFQDVDYFVKKYLKEIYLKKVLLVKFCCKWVYVSKSKFG